MKSHRLVSNLRWLVLAYVAQKLATLAGLIFLARYLGDADFGGFAIALAIPTALEAVTDLGLGWALVREGAGRPELARALAIAALPPKLALGGLTIGMSFVIASSLSLPGEVVDAAVLLAVARALDSVTYLSRALFQAYERMEFDAAAQFLDAVVRLALTVYAVLGGFGLTGLAKALVVAAAIVFAGTAAIAIHRFLRPIRARWGLLPGLVAAGLPLAAVWFLDGLMLRLGIVLTGNMAGREAAGNLAAALRLIEPLLGFAALASTALLPLTTRHVVEERGTVPWLLHASVKMAVIAGLGPTLVLVGSGATIVDLVFGREFAEARDLVRILALSIVPLFVRLLLVPLLLALRRQSVLIIAQLAGVSVNAVVVLGLGPAWGPAAAAAGLLGGEVVAILVAVAGVRELRQFDVLGAVAVVWLAIPASLGLLLTGAIGETAATAVALFMLFVGVRTFGVIAHREIVYLEGVGPRFGRLSRVLLAPLR